MESSHSLDTAFVDTLVLFGEASKIKKKRHFFSCFTNRDNERISSCTDVEAEKDYKEIAMRKQQLRKHLIIAIRQSSQVTFNYIALKGAVCSF